MAEWLKRLTRNQVPLWCVGSNPTSCVSLSHRDSPCSTMVMRHTSNVKIASSILVKGIRVCTIHTIENRLLVLENEICDDSHIGICHKCE